MTLRALSLAGGLLLAATALSSGLVAAPLSLGKAVSGYHGRIAHGWIPAGMHVEIVREFALDRAAAIRVRGGGTADLDLFVFDRENHLVAHDIGDGDASGVRFTPRVRGPFRIVIRNDGSLPCEYILRTN